MTDFFREEKMKYLETVYADFPKAKISESLFLDTYLNDPSFHTRYVRALEKLPRPEGFNSQVKKVIGLSTHDNKLHLFDSAKQAGKVSGSGAHIVLKFCRGSISYKKVGYAWKFEFADVLEGTMLPLHLEGKKAAILRVYDRNKKDLTGVSRDKFEKALTTGEDLY